MLDLALVDDIYEAATCPEKWSRVLDRVARMAGGSGATLFAVRDGDLGGYATSDNLRRSVDAYLSDLAQFAPILPRLVQSDWPGFVNVAEFLADDETMSNALVARWHDAGALKPGATSVIQSPGGDFVVINLQGAGPAGECSPADLERLNAYRPHLARASLLSARWRLDRLRMATEALQLLGLPAALIAHHGQVVIANEAFQGLSGLIAWRGRDRIALTDPAANRALEDALGAIRAKALARSQSFIVRPPQGGQTAVLHVLPTPGGAAEIFDGNHCLAIMLPISAPQTPQAHLIQSLYDLSPREVRTVQQLLTGKSIDEIAQAAALGRETIRSQLKSVYAKMGVRGQTEVLAILSALPRLPGSAGQDLVLSSEREPTDQA